MPPLRTRLLPPCLVALALLAGCGSSTDPNAATPGTGSGTTPGSGSGADRTTIVMIPKGTTHVFWKAVERGARDAAAAHDVDLVWKGPLKENDRAQQIQLVQQFIVQDVDAIALAPLDQDALVTPVADAAASGIPVVIFDSALTGTSGTDFVSFIATDNEAGGRLGGDHLATLLEPGDDVVLLRYLVGSASTLQRESGFLAAMADADHDVLVENRYAGPTAGEAKTTALNMMSSIRAAKGVFCSNESATYGMLLALRQEGLAGQIRFVGFDASPPLVEALRTGEIDALVVQNPRRMGALAIETLVRHLRGEPVETVIDTGAVLVTKANMDDPAIAPLLE
ncbi:MAG: substrate-binding domain-containing protein [Phycisphaerales bacterium]|nr:substrate-binding domain-containing protein [Phycisphaerales bacterium]